MWKAGSKLLTMKTESLLPLLCFVLVKELSFTETNAAALTSRVISKNEKTVRRWRTDMVSNGGAFSESNQGRYQRTGVLWANEELNKKAVEYFRANAAVKGKPNMTSIEDKTKPFFQIPPWSLDSHDESQLRHLGNGFMKWGLKF